MTKIYCCDAHVSHLPRSPSWFSASCHRVQRLVRRNHFGPDWPLRRSRARLRNLVPTGIETCFRAASGRGSELSKSSPGPQKDSTAVHYVTKMYKQVILFFQWKQTSSSCCYINGDTIITAPTSVKGDDVVTRFSHMT